MEKKQVEYVILEELPPDHILRNSALAAIEASYAYRENAAGWRKVAPSFGIAKKTFNQLGDVWISTSVFRVPKR
jgi:hypothetical protein